MLLTHLIIKDPNLRVAVVSSLKKEGAEAAGFDGFEAYQKNKTEPDRLVLELEDLSDKDLQKVSELTEQNPKLYVIGITPNKDRVLHARAFAKGLYDLLVQPSSVEDVLLALQKINFRQKNKVRLEALMSAGVFEGQFGEMLTQSQSMKDLFSTVEKISRYKTTCLVLGESGTGKELMARAIHAKSPRAGAAFVAINCGAIPETLLESELFGHIKGAFTGAVNTKKGLFEEADQGTLFLDEIGELPLLLQVKLLRVLQEEEVRKVGDTQSKKIDVRIIAATLKDLTKAVEQGTFREDLFYRLNVLSIQIPPLRDRKEDIPMLAKHFMAQANQKMKTAVEKIHPQVLKIFMEYGWPGNIRELENVIERAMILVTGNEILVEHLPSQLTKAKSTAVKGGETGATLSIKKMTQTLEENLIQKALETCNGNRTKAAKLLEISHRALLYKMKEFGLD